MRREPLALLPGEGLDGNCHSFDGGQRTAHCRPGLGRNVRLVVPLVAAGLLPGRTRSGLLPRLLRGAVSHGRAEHDRLPAARRRAVRALGGAGARRLRVRAEAAGSPAARARRVRVANACARRPARAGADLPEEQARRGRGRAAARLARSQFRYLRLREPPYDDAALQELAGRLRAVAEPTYVYFRHEDEPTAPAYAERLLELLGTVPSA